MSVVLLAVEEGKDTVSVALALLVLAVVDVAVAVDHAALAVGLSGHHLALVLPRQIAFLDLTGAQRDLLRRDAERKRNK